MEQIQQLAERPHERRQFQRVRLVLLGRFMLENAREFPCQSIDISPGGVGLRAPVTGRPGEHVVLYFEELGRLEGRIARLTGDGFGVACNNTRHRQEKLANQLMWLANRDLLSPSDERRAVERVAPIETRSTLRLPDGREFAVRLIDISREGAAIATIVDLPVGMDVVIGRTHAQIARQFTGGLGVTFKTPLMAKVIEENIIL